MCITAGFNSEIHLRYEHSDHAKGKPKDLPFAMISVPSAMKRAIFLRNINGGRGNRACRGFWGIRNGYYSHFFMMNHKKSPCSSHSDGGGDFHYSIHLRSRLLTFSLRGSIYGGETDNSSIPIRRNFSVSVRSAASSPHIPIHAPL